MLHVGPVPIILMCTVVVAVLFAAVFGLSYLAGRLAEKHGNYWEKKLQKESEKCDD